MKENQKQLIEQTIQFVKVGLENAEGGHDWWHIYRVWKLAAKIAKEESADKLIVQQAALLHDIADSKFNDGDENIGPNIAYKYLIKSGIDVGTTNQIVSIIRHMSFKNTFDKNTYNSLELDVVRDADRLDAIGAIGIARTFNFGGHIGSEIYNPNIKVKLHQTKEEYKSSKEPTINHFYKKLLLLKDMMTTKTGKKLAENRHHFMETFLNQFYNEWEGIY
jgi:uncharacterized protein